jgi:hypothetical protein
VPFPTINVPANNIRKANKHHFDVFSEAMFLDHEVVMFGKTSFYSCSLLMKNQGSLFTKTPKNSFVPAEYLDRNSTTFHIFHTQFYPDFSLAS